jgi:hypothetical protein
MSYHVSTCGMISPTKCASRRTIKSAATISPRVTVCFVPGARSCRLASHLSRYLCPQKASAVFFWSLKPWHCCSHNISNSVVWYDKDVYLHAFRCNEHNSMWGKIKTRILFPRTNFKIDRIMQMHLNPCSTKWNSRNAIWLCMCLFVRHCRDWVTSMC